VGVLSWNRNLIPVNRAAFMARIDKRGSTVRTLESKKISHPLLLTYFCDWLFDFDFVDGEQFH